MTNSGYYPRKLIYISSNGHNTKAILVSSPDRFTADVILETIKLGDSAFEDEYRQVAAACGAEFVDVNDIKIIGQDDQPTISKNNRDEGNEK